MALLDLERALGPPLSSRQDSEIRRAEVAGALDQSLTLAAVISAIPIVVGIVMMAIMMMSDTQAASDIRAGAVANNRF